MGTALLVGIPSGYVGTVKTLIEKNRSAFDSWPVKYLPTSRKEAEISGVMVRQALELAAKYDGTHVFGFSAQSHRQSIAKQINQYFRFRWFNHALLKSLGSPDPRPFMQELLSDLEQESVWAARVKPLNLGSPLLLPECSFQCGGKNLDLWRHASSYGDPGNILGAEKAIKAFKNAHSRKIENRNFATNKWVDQGDRIFDTSGERHGVAPFPRGWKYSYRIETGFHFDVRHINGRQFVLVDAMGMRNRVKTDGYLNIDPHGYVRG
jgi:hypothetical protein